MANNFPTIGSEAFQRESFRGRHDARLKRKVNQPADRWQRQYRKLWVSLYQVPKNISKYSDVLKTRLTNDRRANEQPLRASII